MPGSRRSPRELDKRKLLERLPAIDPKEELEGEEEAQQVSLSTALLMLAEIDHEHEYALCRGVAEHLLGEAHEPEDVDLGE